MGEGLGVRVLGEVRVRFRGGVMRTNLMGIK
jgi:hypothetical protein